MGQARVREILEIQFKKTCYQYISKPDTVEDVTIRIDSDINIGHDYLVLLGFLLITEKCVWHPHFCRVCEGEVIQLTWTPSLLDCLYKDFLPFVEST